MQIALGQSDICEFESYMPSHAVWSRPLDSALSARGNGGADGMGQVLSVKAVTRETLFR
jgi:hypothetical protein